ncbi:MAG: restriction endonuclease subunit S [Nitrospirae bacterium]|nr:restriction endonuclease subunit S [Nitrospirota bacterium]
MKDIKKQLPKGWKWAKLGGKNGIAEIINGSTPSTDEPAFWNGDILWATPTDLGKLDSIYIEDTERKITRAGLESCSTKLLPVGTVLLTSRAPVGNIAITKKPLCTNQGFKNFVPKEGIHSPYLYFAIKMIIPEIQKQSHGNTFVEITKDLIKHFEIPLPPTIDDQIAIANELELRMAEVETMRQAALRQKEAVSAMAGGILRDIFPVKSEADLPKGWMWVKLESLCEIVNGFGFPKHLQGQKNMPYPYIKVSDMNHMDSQVIMLKAENYVDENILNSIGAKGYPAGTVIFPKVGGALLTNKKRMLGVEATFDNNIMGLIPKSNTKSKYLYYWIGSIDLADIANTQALPSIRKSDIANLKIPLPPTIDDQIAIANELERKMAEVSTVHQASDSQLEAIEAIPGAILREVFDFGKN